MSTGPRILFIEKQGDLLVITFSDGSCALYTSELLHSMLPRTIQILDNRKNQKRVRFDELSDYDDRRL
jgi:hypothetical protein